MAAREGQAEFDEVTEEVPVEATPVLLTEVEDAQAVALSVEAEGGSDQPTTTPLTAVPLR